MTQNAELTEDVLKDLAKLARPFIDTTPNHVVRRLIDHFKQSVGGNGKESIHTYSLLTPPDLSHTRVVDFKLNGRPMAKPNWNAIMDRAINLAATKLGDVDKLDALVLARHVKGQKIDQGFRFFPGAKISVQGQDANGAWRTAAHLFHSIGMSAEVTFAWYDHPKAANPGKVGKFVTGDPDQQQGG